MMNTRHFASTLLAAGLLALGLAAHAAADLPGKGVKVQPLQSALTEETFQTLLVSRALEKLGYDVQPIKEVAYPTAHLAVANGDATFIANHWNPHHSEFYKTAGGDAKLSRRGVYSAGAAQGYLIDKKTADQYKITHLSQLTDPKLAQLFDSTGDGKADLIGASAGWGGEAVIEHHLTTFKLRDTVTYTQGNYPALISNTVARFKAGKPVLYYAWTPYWLSNVLRPGKEVVWLEVPFSAMPGLQAGTDTRLPNGKNYGFPLNNEYIVANKAFVEKNPAAAKLFEVMELPIGDISRQNRRLRDGENRQQDIERHTDSWIKAHQKTFDGWIAQAMAAAK
ncbi:glycine betaine ABC transporter substrate-binding protein [Acidovorax sp. SRB_14]|uniref:glycine betaine/L-proline ABC transporter substrate-binding protein ProX n=1 Tax=unclassified Acidovorax TaxID=2684926 RepID=UPI00145F07B9|nr:MULTISPECIES: glycine betaine/L-proline ABC transporter substrate-binding protein ProX [unclassified Acidovorax]NMM77414.1 glycine betaine ABC transporter substrate-binding protein [Acidovorax sp. SRB_24]NMM82080.1 glycine betaine ABC transporter substrate-binding protein [Acidovorax sp. SRB_14]NMM87074.1 glycine betaine ABC transporter substrate-binding protein [Rhodococcus sp. SRB_17]